MRQACSVPMAAGAALMPDAHVGYGLPIGGVLALENAVIPYAVGVDIACRMKLSVLDMPPRPWTTSSTSTRKPWKVGLGSASGRARDAPGPPRHGPGLDRSPRITREKKDLAWSQLGTSGSGNHFVEFGVLDLPERDDELGLDAGQYVAIMSHSGSRGPVRLSANLQRHCPIPTSRPSTRIWAYLSWLVAGQRGRPGVLGGHEPDGRLRRRQP